GRSGGLNDATGEVSDRPYPSRITHPKAASNPRSTSTGSAAPPETPTRRVETSQRGRSGQARRATYIVGTPSKTVTRPRAINSSAFSGVNRDTRVRRAPTRTAVLRPQVWPKEWNSGRPPKMTSSGPTWTRSVAVTSTLDTRLAWVSSAPLGRPVVPDV